MVREIIGKNATFYRKLGTIFNWKTGSNTIANDNFSSFAKNFDHELSFRQIYKFLKAHKEVAYLTPLVCVKSAKTLHYWQKE